MTDRFMHRFWKSKLSKERVSINPSQIIKNVAECVSLRSSLIRSATNESIIDCTERLFHHHGEKFNRQQLETNGASFHLWIYESVDKHRWSLRVAFIIFSAEVFSVRSLDRRGRCSQLLSSLSQKKFSNFTFAHICLRRQLFGHPFCCWW